MDRKPAISLCRCTTFVVLALLLAPLASTAQEFAKLPYALIYQMEEAENNLSKTYTNLYMFIRITPTTPGVQIKDVNVYIDAKEGRIPVTLNPTNGSFSVPMRDKLLAEGAWIVTSQPKGTMNFGWYVGLTGVKPPSDGIRYRELMRPVEDMIRIHREMAKIPGIPPLLTPVLKMVYTNDTGGTIVIRASSGDKIYKTDGSHAVIVPLDPIFLTENPEVGIPVPAAEVVVTEQPENDKPH